MAVMGPGNFDRDDAHNVLAFVLEDIIKEIRHGFTFDSKESLYDDLGEAVIIANIDILLTLCDHYKTHPSTLRKLDEVIQWKKEYLTTFDRTAHLYSESSEYIGNRRSVIVETFDKLYNLIKEMYGNQDK